MTILTLLCAISTSASSASGQDGGVRLEKGKPAPFSGLLFTVEDALLPAIELEKCEESKALELKRLKERHELQTELAAVKASTDREALRLQLVVVQEDRQRLSAWYRSPVFWGAVCLAAGIGLTLGVFKIAAEMENP